MATKKAKSKSDATQIHAIGFKVDDEVWSKLTYGASNFNKQYAMDLSPSEYAKVLLAQAVKQISPRKTSIPSKVRDIEENETPVKVVTK